MSKTIKYNFSDDSFEKIFDIESIKHSIKKDSFTRYINRIINIWNTWYIDNNIFTL